MRMREKIPYSIGRARVRSSLLTSRGSPDQAQGERSAISTLAPSTAASTDSSKRGTDRTQVASIKFVICSQRPSRNPPRFRVKISVSRIYRQSADYFILPDISSPIASSTMADYWVKLRKKRDASYRASFSGTLGPSSSRLFSRLRRSRCIVFVEGSNYAHIDSFATCSTVTRELAE